MAVSKDMQLNIVLDEPERTYQPSDQIQGRLFVHLAKDRPIGSVVVRLFGSAESRIDRSNGQSTSTFRGSASLFDLEEMLYTGHYTHKSGRLEWPFTFTIPETADPSANRTNWKSAEGFLACSENEDPPLPPSFVVGYHKAGKNWSARCSYGIEAIVSEPEDRGIAKQKPESLVQLIWVLPSATSEQVDISDPGQRCGALKTLTVKSPRLSPEHAGQSSIFSKTKSLLNPSSVPKFTFNMDISYPSMIQSLHPGTVPVVLSASPRTEAALTTIQPSQQTFYRYPSIDIKCIKLTLQAITRCRCPSLLSDVTVDSSHDILLLERRFDTMSLGMRSVA